MYDRSAGPRPPSHPLGPPLDLVVGVLVQWYAALKALLSTAQAA